MQFYIAIEGEKRGPFPIYRVIDQLRAGEVSPDALGWESGMASWCKLRDIPAFAEAIEVIENPPEPEAVGEDGSPGSDPPAIPDPRQAQPGKTGHRSQSPASPLSERRPFTRLCARFYDYLLVFVLVAVFVEVPPLPFEETAVTDASQLRASFQSYLDYLQDPKQLRFAYLIQVSFLLWHVLEGLLLHLLGTTPGKFVFGIRVVAGTGATPLSLGKGIYRAFLVLAAGLGFGVAFLPLIGGGVALYMLLTQGTTLWDRVTDSRVHHLPVTPQRILIAMGGFLLLMILSSLSLS